MTYNHVYLGREPYDGDLVFPTISKDKHFGQHKDFDPDVITVGVDVGLGDATVFCMNGFQMNRSDLKVGLGIHNWWWKPNANNGFGADIRDGKQFKFFPLTLYDLYNRLMDFLNMVHNEYPHLPIFLQIDYAGYGQALYDELLVRHPKPSWVITSRCWMKEPLVDRIKLIQDLLTLPDALKIYDINTFNAYANQIWDTKIYKDGARRLDDPTNEGLDMDRQDACEYGIPHQLYLLIKKRLSINRGKWKN
ncbi:MAG: hypothetical protein HUJ52_03640 [Malacoplasma sp.]|nr:hypothetical protein [Malacoplasma sp.]